MEISVRQMYRIEERGHAMGFRKELMMENAGAAAARLVDARLGGAASRRILVLAGLGNNGGDGLVAARHLAGRGARVRAALLGEPGDIRTEECSRNWALLRKMPSVETSHGAAPEWGPGVDAAVDAMLGTGISGGIREPYATAIAAFSGAGCLRVAVDAPSGLDPDTGAAADPCARADVTVTFHRSKRGLPARPDLTGELVVEPIGIPPEAEEGVL